MYEIFDILDMGVLPPKSCIPNPMETTMNSTVVDYTKTARNAIDRAISKLEVQVNDAAYITFHLEDATNPRTAQELVDLIKADEYILPDTENDDYDEEDYKYATFRGLRFKPKHKKDRAGYDKYMKKF